MVKDSASDREWFCLMYTREIVLRKSAEKAENLYKVKV